MSNPASDLVRFESAPCAVRGDILEAHRRFWRRLAAPGTWLTGAERVAVAAEVRAAAECRLCARRRQAVSPYAVAGEHDGSAGASALLGDAWVDAIHRITTDASRLSASWYRTLLDGGVPDTHYVEMLGLIVSVVSIDAFCLGLGTEPHPLPTPEAGEPSRIRPAAARMEGAWVPMLPAGAASGSEADLWRSRTGNVIRALSLVPEAVRDLKSLSAAHYLPTERVIDPSAHRTLTRPQIELLAGRVSALNECFY